MKTTILSVLIFFVALISCNGQNENYSNETKKTSKTKNDEGLHLFKQNCYACHSVTTKSHSEIIAPPMIAVKKRYKMQYDTKKEFVNAVVAYAYNPKVENALMLGAIDKFKAMPKQNFKRDDLTKIASYIYDSKIETPVWFQDQWMQNNKMGMGRK